MRDRLDAITSAVRYSPRAHIPVDHSKSSDVMQKKVIDCPISSHEPLIVPGEQATNARGYDIPVSCTWKKKVRVIPSVSVKATSNSEKGGNWRVLFKTANVTDKMM